MFGSSFGRTTRSLDRIRNPKPSKNRNGAQPGQGGAVSSKENMENISSVASKINEPDLSGWVPTLSLRAALAGEWELSSVGQAMTTEELYWSEAVHAALAGRELPELVELQFIRTVIDGALAYERALHDPRQLDAFFKAAGFRPKSIRHAAARSPHPRSTREPRRRASRSAAAATRAGPGDGDGPPPPEDPPRRRASQQGPSSLGRTAKPEPVRSDWRGRALRLIGGGR